eukprot:TRINITY_DN6595_c0_g1_i1.p1 TRINITY_DN6595_c0_g1~~TRINITY_DN6595_c0_g1_i1.p1  ORF type:complete len:145 (+),score=17.75 TRINITY_DN6595_c0_g1_i1:89-523(+)
MRFPSSRNGNRRKSNKDRLEATWSSGVTLDGTCVYFLSGYCRLGRDCPHKHYSSTPEPERAEQPPALPVQEEAAAKPASWYRVVHKTSLAKLRRTECSICLENMSAPKTNPVGKVRSCGHNFHVSCLSEWSKRRSACPLCDCPL